ncbi:hypothetical protein [Cohnella sp.]|uniref:hypothetical protein n=1 Tax=Cohnella sp. TaxID=1883426 RepID=UPI00356287EE
MRVIIGCSLIFLTYYLMGLILDSSFFEEPDYSYLIEYLVLALIGLPNCILSLRMKIRNLYLKWILYSTVPGLLFMLFARFQESSGGFISFSWDWGLWELFLPAIYTVVQIIFILYILAIRNEKKTKES